MVIGNTKKNIFSISQKNCRPIPIYVYKKEENLTKNIINEPISEDDFKHNLKLANEYIILVERKRKAFTKLTSFLETDTKGRHNTEINQELNNLKLIACNLNINKYNTIKIVLYSLTSLRDKIIITL